MSEIPSDDEWRVQCMRHDMELPDDEYSHRHAFHEVVHCRRGHGVQFAEDTRRTFSRGDVFYLAAGVEHRAGRLPESECTLDVLYFPSGKLPVVLQANPIARAVMEYLQRRTELRQYHLRLTEGTRRQVAELFDRMLREDRTHASGYPTAMRLLFQQLLLVLMRDESFQPEFQRRFASDGADGRIRRVETYIRTHYMKPLSVESLASLACLSRSQFHAAFKRATGKTTRQYVQSVRVDHARQMLTRNEFPIVEIAWRCGFENLSHFYHVFKRYTGSPPGEYARVK